MQQNQRTVHVGGKRTQPLSPSGECELPIGPPKKRSTIEDALRTAGFDTGTPISNPAPKPPVAPTYSQLYHSYQPGQGYEKSGVYTGYQVNNYITQTTYPVIGI